LIDSKIKSFLDLFDNNDLYSINKTRTEPDPNINPKYDDFKVPIRNGDICNLVLKLLNIKSVEGSWINESQDLKIN
jgi:hypothetical protein